MISGAPVPTDPKTRRGPKPAPAMSSTAMLGQHALFLVGSARVVLLVAEGVLDGGVHCSIRMPIDAAGTTRPIGVQLWPCPSIPV